MKFKSFLADILDGYIAYRIASGRTSMSYVRNIVHFDSYCAREYSNAKDLDQTMVDKWFMKRDTEHPNSCISRVYPVISFLRYANQRSLINIVIPPVPRPIARTYMPHAFTQEELRLFFDTCDTIITRKGINGDIRRITIPVFFRLLYSSGLRTTEARLLRVEDVNLENGVVNIQRSKGYNQHYTVLHDTMLDLMKLYNIAISKLIPARIYFFPTEFNRGHSPGWITYNFRKLWFQNNKAYAIAYELRHHYATQNINCWIDEGFNSNIKLLSLSKSMGHSDIESTRYYYSLVPGLSDIIENLTGVNFNEIIPNITNNEKGK